MDTLPPPGKATAYLEAQPQPLVAGSSRNITDGGVPTVALGSRAAAAAIPAIEGVAQHRTLAEEYSVSSAGMIAWYCLIFFTVLPAIAAVIYCWYSRVASYRRARLALQRELETEREQQVLLQMRANIQAFSDAEKSRRRKIMQLMLRKQTMEVDEHDLVQARREERKMYADDASAPTAFARERTRSFGSAVSSAHSRNEPRLFGRASGTVSGTASGTMNGDNGIVVSTGNHGDMGVDVAAAAADMHLAHLETVIDRDCGSIANNNNNNNNNNSSNEVVRLKATSCSICLDAFGNGDVVAHAWDDSCKHVFHEDCIVMWLITQQQPLCPCCRQHFTHSGATNKQAPKPVPAAPGNQITPQSLSSDPSLAVLEPSVVAATANQPTQHPARPRPRATGLASVVITIPRQRPHSSSNHGGDANDRGLANDQTPGQASALSSHSRTFGRIIRGRQSYCRSGDGSSSTHHHRRIQALSVDELQTEPTERDTSNACSSRWDGELVDDVDIDDGMDVDIESGNEGVCRNGLELAYLSQSIDEDEEDVDYNSTTDEADDIVEEDETHGSTTAGENTVGCPRRLRSFVSGTDDASVTTTASTSEPHSGLVQRDGDDDDDDDGDTCSCRS